MKRQIQIVSIIILMYTTGTQLKSMDTLFIKDIDTEVFFGKYCTLSESGVKGNETNNPSQKNIPLSPDKLHIVSCYVKNVGNRDREFLLFFHNAQLDTAYYIVSGNGTIVRSQLTTCNKPAYQRPTKHRTLSLPLTLEKDNTYLLEMKIYGREFDIAITPQIVDATSGLSFKWTDLLYIFLFLFSGIILLTMVILFLLGQFYPINVKNSLTFLAYGVTGFLYLIATSGYGSLYIWGEYPWFEVNSPIFFGCLSSIALIELGRRIYNFQFRNPRLNQYFFIFYGIYFVVASIGFYHYYILWYPGFYRIIVSVPYIMSGSCLIIMLWTSYIHYYKNHKKDYLLLLLFYLCHFIFLFLIVLLELNIITYNYKLHSIINICCYLPQIFILLYYLIYHLYYSLIENERKFETIKSGVIAKLYDSIGENLSRISLQAYLVSETDDSDQKLKSITKTITNNATRSLSSLSELMSDLTQNELDHFELESEIRHFVSEFGSDNRTKFVLNLNHHSSLWTMEGYQYKQILRIVKEAVNNAIKHAKANAIYISLESERNHQLKLVVADNGIGFIQKEADHQGHGLKSMRDRAQRLNGHLEIKSDLNGTIVILLV